MHLTESVIQNLQPTGKQYDVWDDDEKGLIVRVNSNGSKTYYAQYGRGKRIKVARFGEITLKFARLRTKEIIISAKNGQLEKQKPVNQITYKDYLDEIDGPWLRSNIKSGQETYEMLTAHFVPLFGNLKLNEITPLQLERWKTKRLDSGVKKCTINRNLGAFKASLNRAVELKYLQYNPISQVKLFKVKDERFRYLADDEKARLLSHLPKFDKWFQTIILLALNTGLRKSNIIRLEWENVMLTSDYPCIVVKPDNFKGNKLHSVPLNKTAYNALIDWKANQTEQSKFVFINPQTGQPYNNIRKPFARLLKLAEITNFRFHDQRHDCASSLVKNGVDLYTVSKILGHADTKMTQRYAHLAPKTLADAVAKLD